MKRILFTIIGLFLLACGFLTPSRPNNETILVGRHPEQWMPSYKTFIAINNNAPFTGEFAYPNENQGITSYGFSWIEPDCSKSFSSSVYAGEVYSVLYKSISDVQSKIPNIEQYYKDLDGFQKNEVVNLRTGNTATISFYQITSCETTNHWATIMFRRNNVLGFANAQTYQINSDDILRDIVSDLGSQLDQVIQSEISNHPGSESDLIKVSNSARTIELPSDTSSSQSPTDLGNPDDYIEGDLYCSEGGGFYKVSGVLTNKSDHTINIMVEWGASPASDVMGTSYTRQSETVVLWGGETKIVSSYGAAIIYDNQGSFYYNCEIYSQISNWWINP